VTSNATTQTVSVTADQITVHELTIVHAEAAAILSAVLTNNGPDAAVQLVQRALPVGLAATQLGNASMDMALVERTLTGFRTAVDRSAQAAAEDIATTVAQLRDTEQSVRIGAEQALAGLQARIEAALAGEAATVRDSVRAATADVHAAMMRDLREALNGHSSSVRNAISMDAGPIQALRLELLSQLDRSRAELNSSLAALSGQLQASAAAQQAGRKSSRAVGDAWELVSMAAVRHVVTGAGDLFVETGSQAAPGTTSRTGDGLATIQAYGPGVPQRVAFEAKQRGTRAMSAANLLKELKAAAQNRQAQVAIAVVPSTSQVPGGGLLARLAANYWVVALEDGDHTALSLVYLVARELSRAATVASAGPDPATIPVVSAHLASALEGLSQFGDVKRHATAIQRSVNALLLAGEEASKRVFDEITSASRALNQAGSEAA
jgi:hypothetical protein